VVGAEDYDGVFALVTGFEGVEDFAEVAVHFRAIGQVVAETVTSFILGELIPNLFVQTFVDVWLVD